ncbi:MAG TPA: glutaredoxin family protein [Burkholderiales bacterium]|nr:glutaredoxin family protein [Burkholderiales bacterium]
MRILFVAAAILSTVCAGAFGQAYRWVDQDGRIHYTQTPPPPDAKGVQRKSFQHGPMGTVDLPYATQVAAKNFPVTLYTLPDCGPFCDQARALLVKRAVPFREVSVVTQKDLDEVKRLSGKGDLPLLLVGTLVQTGFQESLFNGLLDSAGYPSSVPPARIETLRKMDPAASAPATAQGQSPEGAGAGTEPAASAGAR